MNRGINCVMIKGALNNILIPRLFILSPTPLIFEFINILGFLVNINNYSTAISSFCQLEFNGITPSIVTLSILMNSYYQVSYAILLNELCKMGETRAAMQMLRKIWVNTDLVMYRTIIDSLCKDKLVNDDYELYPAMIRKQAISVLAMMMKKGVHPNVVTYGWCQMFDATISLLINGLCEKKRVDEAMNLFGEMHGEKIIPFQVARFVIR
ncbi:PPR superfamily protein [Medicago truncatula]|uniref:PPR superfamily protein n=1 Tax=Medicago truncatula TaxID=3880 RepID=G7IWR0_MEDTR|nr:PPR superfamily protein [Medicago truncatula]